MSRPRGYVPYNPGPATGEKLICAASYLTGGIAGFVWIIFCYFTKQHPKDFVKYHTFQAIFISILLWLFTTLLNIIMAFIKFIPFLGSKIINLIQFFMGNPFLLGYSIFHLGLIILTVYLVVTSLQGKFSYIPWISDTIKKMM